MSGSLHRCVSIDRIFGRHTTATRTGIYGNVPQGMLSERVTMIEAARFALA
jgi:hypothetical protein